MEGLINYREAKAGSIFFELQVDDAVNKLDKTIIIQVFRVIQESLTNIIRHAHAIRVTIRLDINTGSNALKLYVSDNGQDCELNRVTGFGLQGMAERVKLLGGEFELQSRPDEGIQIQALIPTI